MSNVSDEEMESARNPGVIEVLKERLSIATDIPILFGLYVILGISALFLSSLSSFVSVVIPALGTLFIYRGMGQRDRY